MLVLFNIFALHIRKYVLTALSYLHFQNTKRQQCVCYPSSPHILYFDVHMEDKYQVMLGCRIVFHTVPGVRLYIFLGNKLQFLNMKLESHEHDAHIKLEFV